MRVEIARTLHHWLAWSLAQGSPQEELDVGLTAEATLKELTARGCQLTTLLTAGTESFFKGASPSLPSENNTVKDRVSTQYMLISLFCFGARHT